MTADIPVSAGVRAVRIQADHVYVVPPNRRLEVADGMVNVYEITQPEQRRSPVDVFFRSLADAHGSRAVCIVLSGTGSNGSAGLKRVKEYGGLAIAQTPSEAEYEDMPTNAIATGLVDLVLPVAEMPARIADYHQRLRQFDGGAPDGAEPVDESDALRDVLSLLRVRTGHDFVNYKSGTLLRRIQRRMNVAAVSSLGAYARLIREQPEEAVTLMKDLLISVTHFFRDTDAFTALEERVIPRLFDNKGHDDQVRIWVPGCATGEEAYSVAMLLAEFVEGRADAPGVQVFATDLDEDAIAAAREGFYTESDVADLPEKRLAAILPPRRHRLSHPAGAPRNDAVRASQRHQGSAVLARRSDLLPESADLSQPDGAAADPRDVSFRRCGLAGTCCSVHRSRRRARAISSSSSIEK